MKNGRVKVPLYLSERLRRARRQQKLTQVGTAKLAKVSAKVLWGMEKPRSHVNDQFETLTRVVKALGGRIEIWLPGEPLPAPIDYQFEEEVEDE